MKKLTLTVGIPAFNEAQNITALIEDVLSQNYSSIVLKKIIISSDGSTDATCTNVRQIRNTKIQLFENKDRKGIARGLNQIIQSTSTDTLVLLNADIRLSDKNCLEELVKPIREQEADLTSCPMHDPDAKSQLSRALKLSMLVKENTARHIRHGDHYLTCHGTARGFSKKFYSHLFFPSSVGEDAYSYVSCKAKHGKYVYCPNTTVIYKLPESLVDHLKQSRRYLQNHAELTKYLSSTVVQTELALPISAKIKGILISLPVLVTHPQEVVYYLYLLLVSHWSFIRNKKEGNAWVIAHTSKQKISL